MLTNALVIAASRAAAGPVLDCLRSCWPAVAAELYVPEEAGRPDAAFPWSMFEVLLLSFDIGLEQENGLAWIERLQAMPGCPPIIFLTSGGGSKRQLRALKLGAASYLDDSELQPEQLGGAVCGALGMAFGPPWPPPTGDTGPGADSSTGSLAVAGQGAQERISAGDVSEGPRASPRSDATTMIEDGSEPGMLASQHAAPAGEAAVPMIGGELLQVPSYRVIKQIGAGGMATVFLAEREEDDLSVVLKVMHIDDNDDPESLRRFLREYTVIGNVDHPNVVKIYERAFASDYAYIAMEYFDAGDLQSRIHQRIPLNKTREYLRAIAHGLGAAHQCGIIHRDIKPANVLFRSDDTLALTDFGASSMLGADHTISQQGQVLGTPHYLSPEQSRGATASVCSDLYALGIVLHELLTGKRPFVGKRLSELLYAHTSEPIPRLPGESATLQPVLDGLLAKDPDERFQTTDELLAALDWV